ncbi:MAG: phosphoglycerate kinase [bacterium]
MKKLSIEDVDISDKKVLVRVDYNVPLKKDGNGGVQDNTRIKATLPTLRYLLEHNAKIILISHLGRPKGKVNLQYSLKGVAYELSNLIARPVTFIDDCIGENAFKAAANLKSGEILLLENLRFYPEEEKNDPGFAQKLASLGEIFVQEAFGTVHRAHASTEGAAKYLTSVLGFLVSKEIEYMDAALSNPKRPFLAILGGAKVSDKIGVIKNLLSKVDFLVIGGGMSYTFLKSQGVNIGKSLLEAERIEEAASILKDASERKVTIVLPVDHVIAKEISSDAESKVTKAAEIDSDFIGVDIGPMTVEKIAPIVKESKTIVWNGPMGVFEIDKFSKGTMAVVQQVAEATSHGAISIVGGGDSISAIKKSGKTSEISHISTGGGASLEFLEGKKLPGLEALTNKE